MPSANLSPPGRRYTVMSCCDGIRLDDRTLALLEHVLVLRAASRAAPFPSTEEFRWPRLPAPFPPNSLRRGSWCVTGPPDPARRLRPGISSRVSRKPGSRSSLAWPNSACSASRCPRSTAARAAASTTWPRWSRRPPRRWSPARWRRPRWPRWWCRTRRCARRSRPGSAPPGWHSSATWNSTRRRRRHPGPCRGCWAGSPMVCCWCRPGTTRY